MVIIPKDYQHALDLIQDEKMQIIAGGTDVMVKKRSWSGLKPNIDLPILNISHLKDLSYIREDYDGIHIGATTLLEDLIHSPLVPEPLKAAVREMASPAIRHVGTLGGNVGNASPAGDTLPILYVFDARVVLESVDDIRLVAVSEFFTNPSQTVKKTNELIKEIILKDIDYSGFYYEKVGGRKSDAISKVSFIATYSKDEDAYLDDIRIAFGAVYKTVVRNRTLEKKLKDALNQIKTDTRTSDALATLTKAISDQFVNEILQEFSELIRPIDDQRSSAKYRKMCAINLLKSFVSMIGG